ncbi:phage holin family protein [Helicobacter sp. 11S02629-2]|uniref:phage holin family protein n=1 Tax=Helicobacter sp. 11S02629-2 TaxID=1476195 RepID=UPI000BA60A8B|nr:phage holin family protein [Helicobacter sp. 11S02629-2]PAF42760.1 hypothetical protein BKH40_07650 [Helicobacter sp. 11S02629-2]
MKLDAIIQIISAYMAVIFVAIFVALVMMLDPKRQMCEEGKPCLGRKIRHVIHSLGLSIFICYVSYEIFVYFGFYKNLAVALSGAVSYFGTDKINQIIDKLIDKHLK